MFKSFVFLILSLVFAALTVNAEPFRRSVEFEWDAIEGAKSYEIELKIGAKVLKFNSTDAQWSGLLAPGVYEMRIRAKDRRGVPAAWSPPEEFKVGLETAKLLQPKSKEEINTNQKKEADIQFQWEPVGGAEKYVFELTTEDGEIVKKEELKEPQIKLTLPVAKKFSWKVKATRPEAESDQVATDEFSLLGQKIPRPQIERPENDFVRQVKWNRPENASNYEYTLMRYDARAKHWEKVSESSEAKESELVFDPKWPGGRYRLSLKATSPLRGTSDKTEMDFMVRNGDRSPAAEETFTIRQSIDRLTGWYAIASYLITMVDYHGANFDKSNSTLNYSAIGGTGRLGAGYLSKSSAWGFLGIGDFSGINVEGSGNFTYASLEGNAIYRNTLSERGELRQSFGLFYKELPETIGKTANAITETNLLKTVGPHYGVEYWYAMTPKLGFQVNAHVYPSLMKIKTTNGEDISPTVSGQVGVLGSYRLKRNVTGLAGYAYRNDQIDYKAQAGKGSANAGDKNSVQLSGHYLNLFLEWAL